MVLVAGATCGIGGTTTWNGKSWYNCASVNVPLKCRTPPVICPCRHEMPGQLAEHRLVLEILLVDLLESEVVRTGHHQAIRKTRRYARRRIEIPPVHPCAIGSLWRPRACDVPVSVTRLVFVERAEDIIEHVRRVGFGHQPHFLGEGMRRVSKQKRIDPARIGGNPRVVWQ